jgi:hypothetical protein
MTDKKKFDALFVREVPRSLINEPIEEPKAETAREIVDCRWHMPQEEEAHER